MTLYRLLQNYQNAGKCYAPGVESRLPWVLDWLFLSGFQLQIMFSIVTFGRRGSASGRSLPTLERKKPLVPRVSLVLNTIQTQIHVQNLLSRKLPVLSFFNKFPRGNYNFALLSRLLIKPETPKSDYVQSDCTCK